MIEPIVPRAPSQAPVSLAARVPDGAAIEGRRVALVPLAQSHAAALFRASHGRPGDDAAWRYMAYGPFPDEPAFAAWIAAREHSTDPRFYAIVDRLGGEPRGVLSFLNIHPDAGSIEIGHIWLGRALRRTAAATEAIFLAIAHAFDALGYRRVEWKCDAANTPSRAAARRFGFRHEGVFWRHLVVKGRNRDTAWYSIIDEEWPAVRAGFVEWLDPANHAADGTQRERLADLIGRRR